MKEKNFDIHKANVLLASTLGIILSSCSDPKGDNGEDDGTDDKNKNKFESINKVLKEIGGGTISDESGLIEIAKILCVPDADQKDVEKVLKALNDKKEDPNVIKKLEELKEKLTSTKLNQEKKDPENLQDVLKKLKESKEDDIKKTAENLLKDEGKIKLSELEEKNKNYYNEILNELKGKYKLVIGKDIDNKNKADVKKILEKLKDALNPKNNCKTNGVENNFKSIIEKLFKSEELKNLKKDEVEKNTLEFYINEDGGKVNIDIEFKNPKIINANIFSNECKKIFAVDSKDNDSFSEAITDDNLEKTTLYKILKQCIESISKIFEIKDSGLEIKSEYSFLNESLKEDLFNVDKIFKDVITKAMESVSNDIKEGSIVIKGENDAFQRALRTVYLDICEQNIVSSELEENFIGTEEVQNWLLRNLGIVKSGDNYVMFKDASNNDNCIKIGGDVKKKMDDVMKKVSVSSDKVSFKAVWRDLITKLRDKVNDAKTKIKGKDANTFYDKIKEAFKNKDGESPIFGLKGKFGDEIGNKWGFSLKDDAKLPDAVIGKDELKFDKAEFYNEYTNRLIMRILAGNFTTKILEKLNFYKCINDNKHFIKDTEYNSIIDEIVKYLKLEKVQIKDKDSLNFLAPYVEIESAGKIKDVTDGSYLKRIGISSYNNVKDLINKHKVDGVTNADHFKLQSIIEEGLSKVNPNGKVYLIGKDDVLIKLNDGLKYDNTNYVTLEGSSGIVLDLLKKKSNGKTTWLDILAVIFKGNIDIYDNNGIVKNDAFSNIFSADVSVTAGINENTNNRNVKISQSGSVSFS